MRLKSVVDKLNKVKKIVKAVDASLRCNHRLLQNTMRRSLDYIPDMTLFKDYLESSVGWDGIFHEISGHDDKRIESIGKVGVSFKTSLLEYFVGHSNESLFKLRYHLLDDYLKNDYLKDFVDIMDWTRNNPIPDPDSTN